MIIFIAEKSNLDLSIPKWLNLFVDYYNKELGIVSEQRWFELQPIYQFDTLNSGKILKIYDKFVFL